MRTRLGSVLAVSLLALMVTTMAGAQTFTGVELKQICTDVVTESGEIRKANDANAGMCIGWVKGLLEMNRLYQIKDSLAAGKLWAEGVQLDVMSLPYFCAPDNITNGRAVAVLMKYVQSHPEMLNESDVTVAVAHAFRETWPCKLERLLKPPPPKKK